MAINLKQARDQNKLEQFVAEREAENAASGDAGASEKIVRSMAGKSSAARPASAAECPDD